MWRICGVNPSNSSSRASCCMFYRSITLAALPGQDFSLFFSLLLRLVRLLSFSHHPVSEWVSERTNPQPKTMTTEPFVRPTLPPPQPHSFSSPFDWWSAQRLVFRETPTRIVVVGGAFLILEILFDESQLRFFFFNLRRWKEMKIFLFSTTCNNFPGSINKNILFFSFNKKKWKTIFNTL